MPGPRLAGGGFFRLTNGVSQVLPCPFGKMRGQKGRLKKEDIILRRKK